MITLNDTEVEYMLERMSEDDDGFNVRQIAVMDGPEQIAFEDQTTGEPFDADTIKRIFEAARKSDFLCRCCGIDKPITEWTRDSHGVDMCAACMTEAEWENAHSDHDHEHTPDPACPICKVAETK